ncbi:MAG: hypothetical protein J1E34_00655 [Oscillospiraceae bacterium]|nr:hypothetical protein [Oscillospiraceae bacterium]
MKIYKRIITLLLICVLCAASFSFFSFAENGTATVSVELLSIGSGYIVSPTQVAVSGTERASEVLMRLVSENGYVCYFGGERDSSFYLAYIADGNKSGRYNGYKCSSELYPVSSPKTLNLRENIPETTKDFLSKYADFFDEGDYRENFRGYIGEFVYTNGSGWMCSLNGGYSQKDLSAIYLKPGDTLKLQFTLYLGVDLGAADEETQRIFNEMVSKSEQTTLAPETTTKAPETTTKAPETTTNAPETTTKAPEATTKAPEATTKAPESTTKTPESTTKAPESTTKAPETTTKSSETTTKAPEITSAESEGHQTEYSETAEETEAYEEDSFKEIESEIRDEENNSEDKTDISDEPQNEPKRIVIAVIAAAAVVAISAGAVIIIKNKKGEKHSEN